MNDERATKTPGDEAPPRPRRPAGEDDPLGAALRALPPERAGAGFTGRVLARLDAGGRTMPGGSGSHRRRPAFLRPAGWAALAAAALALAVGLAFVRAPAPPRSGQEIASSEPAPPEAPALTVPGDVPPPRHADAAAPRSVATARSPSGGAATLDDLPAAANPGSAPIARGGSRGAGPGAADSSGDVEPTPAPGPAADAVRLAAAGGPEAAGPRRPTSDRGPAAPPSADARSALERMRAELDALRREHRRFEVALAELPEIGRDGQPVVFLGGDEGLGLVLDLGRETPLGEVVEAGERRPSL